MGTNHLGEAEADLSRFLPAHAAERISCCGEIVSRGAGSTGALRGTLGISF